MFTKIRSRMQGEGGFTLIELLVVIIIIAILAAIAIPTFLGQRQKAQDASAKSLLRNAMTAVETTYVETRDFTKDGSNAGAVQTVEPAITFTSATVYQLAGTTSPAAGIRANENEVGYQIFAGHPSQYALGTVSSSGKSYSIFVDKNVGNSFYINAVAASW